MLHSRPTGSRRVTAPRAPTRRKLSEGGPVSSGETSPQAQKQTIAAPSSRRPHPLVNQDANKHLEAYERDVKERFDRIIPVLQRLSTTQHSTNFVEEAQRLTRSELGFDLPNHILTKAWVRPLDMRALFAWCVFQTHQLVSDYFFEKDPLNGAAGTSASRNFGEFLLNCGFHLLDITPCADGRLAHVIAYALRIPFSSVRRRSHAGALFDVERTVNRWVKTEHYRYREGLPSPISVDSHYLKAVLYHFSSYDPKNQGCAAHGSNEALAASAGHSRLLNFREVIQNSFCCGASVSLLLIGIDTDTDGIRVHVPSADGYMDSEQWLSANDLYDETAGLSSDEAIIHIRNRVNSSAVTAPDNGMATFIQHLLINNISQIDYVRTKHRGVYPDGGHAERFIGVGIGFKEIHLRNLTYFAHLSTVEEGASDLDVGIKIFHGLNISRDLPIPIVIRFDYSGRVPGARERAIADCHRINQSISNRYASLHAEGLLYTLLTIRDRDCASSSEIVGSTLDPIVQEAH